VRARAADARGLTSALGASPRQSVGTPYGGNFSQACVIDAAREIHAGRSAIALVILELNAEIRSLDKGSSST